MGAEARWRLRARPKTGAVPALATAGACRLVFGSLTALTALTVVPVP